MSVALLVSSDSAAFTVFHSTMPTRRFISFALSNAVLAALAISGVLALGACGRKPEAPARQEPSVKGTMVVFPDNAGALPGVAVEPVRRGAERVLELPGRLVWNEDRTVRVGSPFSGRVTRILVEPGDTVKAGQPLALLSSADFGAAQADVRKAAADAALAAKALARQRELFDAGIVAQKELEQAQADAARASADMQRAQAALRQAGAGPAAAGAGPDGFALRAPIDGLVVERNINPGMELRPDQPPSAPLFLLTDPNELWAQLDAAEADLALFKPGDTVTLSSTAYPGEAFPARVVKIADYVDPAARSVKVRLAVPNPQRRLKAEMFVTARIDAAGFDGVAVPAKAVFLADNHHYVFVKSGAHGFDRREVKLGASLPGVTEVVAGLEPGAEVVTDGNLYLQDILRDATAVNAARAQAGGEPAGQRGDKLAQAQAK